MQGLPPEALAQALGPAGGGSGSAPGMEAGGAPPGGAPPAPGGGMDPRQAIQLLQQHGITPDNAPMIAEALMAVQGAMGGGGAPAPGGPPPMPPGGMPPGV